MARQYVAVKFNEWDSRTYTYHNDGEPFAVGDRIEVPTPKGHQIVTVVEVTSDAPKFQTTEISGPAPKDDEPATETAVA